MHISNATTSFCFVLEQPWTNFILYISFKVSWPKPKTKHPKKKKTNN